MKLKIACRNADTNTFFYEEITLASTVFQTPESAVAAVRGMYETFAPKVEVLHAVSLEEVERGYYE